SLGFVNHKNGDEEVYNKIKDNVLSELKKSFRPEFLNRLDDIIVFKPLDKKSLVKILDKMLDDFKSRVLNQNIIINFNDDVKNYILENSSSEKYGARPLRRSITKYIEDSLSDQILLGNIKANDSVEVILKDDKICYIKNT
ncbi:Negative regulator of genetic competence ClpC/MecB, partial [Candidatus Arthromitus sp. SFB-1]